MPPPSVSHSCGLSLAYSHQSRVAARRGPVWAEGSGQLHNRASFPCVSVTSFVSAQLTRSHVWASGPLASNSKTSRGFSSPARRRVHGHNIAAVTPSQQHIKSWTRTRDHARHPTATCLGWHAPRKGVASGHAAWRLCG